MVYDIFGQLVADYLGSSGSTLERENIYRGGQLLAVYETGASCYKSISQFVQDFYQGVLKRSPNSTELTNWTATLTQAQAQGQGQLIVAAQSLGTTLFTSSEYAGLNTSNGQFVTDLYAGYLGRAPDGPGYDGWLNALNTGSSRTDVRNGFAYSAEFQNDVGQLCVTTSSTSASIKYVLSDLQGTTRAVMNNSGSSSAVIARHDYLPFGEEIWAGVGLRNASTQAYGTTDGNRQKYGLTERDDATGLDHTWWRKLEGFSGRWTSPDPYTGSMTIGDPQSFSRYTYALNDPANLIDPSGLDSSCTDRNGNPAPCNATCHSSTGNSFPCNSDYLQWMNQNNPQAVSTNTWSWGYAVLPAWMSGHSPMYIGLLPGDPTPREPLIPRPTPAPVPAKTPCVNGAGSGDIGGELITPFFIGPKGGVHLDGAAAYPYFGLAAGTPGKGVAINVTTKAVQPGWNIGASGGFIVGVAYSAHVDWKTNSWKSFGTQLISGTWSFGGTTPGISANTTVVLNPKALQLRPRCP